MKMTNFKTLATLALLCGLVQFSHASEKLADDRACLNCLAVEKKMVGPSFKSIAAKYKGQAEVNSYLAKKIREGGTGVWGKIMMPPMSEVTADEAKTLAAWVQTK